MKTLKKLTLLLAAPFLLTAACTQADLVPEKILPDNTLALLSIRNAERDFFTFQRSAMGLLFKDPAMQPFMNYIGKRLGGPLGEVQKVLEAKEIDLNKYRELLGGGVAAALLFNVNDPPQSTLSQQILHKDVGLSWQPLVLLEINGSRQNAQAAINELKGKILELTNKKPVLDTIKYNDLEFITVDISNPGDPTLFLIGLLPHPSGSLSLAVMLFSSGKPGDVLQAMKTLEYFTKEDSSQATLAESAAFKEHATLTPEKNFFFLNSSLLVAGAKKIVQKYDNEYEAPENLMEALMSPGRPMVIFDSLGVEAFKSYSLTWWMDPNGDLWAQGTLICPEGERRGLSGILNALKNVDCSPLPETPADSMNFGKVQLDLSLLWKNLDTASTRIVGGMKAVAVGAAHAFLALDPEIDLQKNILENLTGEIVLWKSPLSLTEEGLPNSEQLLLIGVKDSYALGQTLDQLYRLAYRGKEIPPIESEIVARQRVFSIPLNELLGQSQNNSAITIPGPGGAEIKVPAFTLNVAMAKGYMLIATQKSAIENFINAEPAESLLAKPGVAEAIRKTGGSHAARFAYMDYAAQLEALQLVWKAIIAPSLADNPDVPQQLLNAVGLLPDVSQIKKYWGFAVSAVEVTPAGLQIKSCSPWPKGIDTQP